MDRGSCAEKLFLSAGSISCYFAFCHLSGNLPRLYSNISNRERKKSQVVARDPGSPVPRGPSALRPAVNHGATIIWHTECVPEHYDLTLLHPDGKLGRDIA